MDQTGLQGFYQAVMDLTWRQSLKDIGVDQDAFRLIEGAYDIFIFVHIDGDLTADTGIYLGQ